MTAEAIIRTERLGKTYPDGNVTAVAEVSLRIAQGEYVAITGPSGSGKSTLLHLLGLLDEPTTGELFFEGQPVSQMRRLDRIRATRIGFVFQAFHLISALTASENVQTPMFEGPLGPRERAAKAARLLEQVGLAHRSGHLPLRLSAGERQRVAIARALANDPVLLLADEPTGNLDSQSGAEILDLFARFRGDADRTLVMITHDNLVAARADRVIGLRDGLVVSDEPNR